MRTKTLLIAAAALAAGILVSSAQTYSQNVVGYYNVPIPANSFYIVANQFNVGVSNGLNEMFAGGLMSDVNFGTNTEAYIWNGSGYIITIILVLPMPLRIKSLYGGGAGFYDGGGDYITTIIPPGSALFIQNLAPATITASVVGSVAQGTNKIAMAGSAGGYFNMVGSPIPLSTNVASAPISFAGTSDPNFNFNDEIYIYTGSGWLTYYYLSAADAAARFVT